MKSLAASTPITCGVVVGRNVNVPSALACAKFAEAWKRSYVLPNIDDTLPNVRRGKATGAESHLTLRTAERFLYTPVCTPMTSMSPPLSVAKSVGALQRWLVLTCLAACGLVFAAPRALRAQTVSSADRLGGRWVLTLRNVPNVDTLTRVVRLTTAGDSLIGVMTQGSGLVGAIRRDSVRFLWPSTVGGTVGRQLVGRLVAANRMAGEWVGGTGRRGTWEAALTPRRAPRATRFITTVQHRTWSRLNPVGLTVVSGDTVTMITTGHVSAPIYVEGAEPGGQIRVDLLSIRLAKPTAIGFGELIPDKFLFEFARQGLDKFTEGGEVWKLDSARGTARWTDSSGRVLDVPLRPMLGSIGVAPEKGEAIARFKEGNFGGNIDYNRIVAGVTLWLPIFERGALLSLGDAHAAQGDGELAGVGLETSVEVTFRVTLVDTAPGIAPRAADGEFLMALGTAGTLDEALRVANTNLASWLQRDYDLSLAALTAVLGSSLVLDIANVWDDHVTVVARISKERIRPFLRVGAR